MFFDIILLNSQHGGRFGIAWLAATRGVRFVTKKQIKELNLLKLCDELKLFIVSYSTSPKKRFSLRLAAILINGVIKIFKEQALTLQGEVFSLISTIHIPSGIGSVADADTGIFETPPTPVPKTKTKRPRKVVTETPEILQSKADELFLQLQLPNIGDFFQPTARADEISIREEMPKRTELIDDDFSLGVRSRKEVEEEMQLLLTKTQEIPVVHPQYPSPVSRPLQNLIEIVAEVHAPKDGFGEDLPAVEQPQRKTAENISIKESDPAIQSIPTEEINLENEVHPRSELLEVVQAADIPPAVENVPTDLLREAAKASKTRKGERRQLVELQAVDEATVRHQQITQQREKLLVKPFRHKFVRINRCDEYNGQFINESCQLPLPYKGIFNENLYSLFWVDEDSENIQMRGMSNLRSLSTRESANLRRTGTISAQPSTLESISDTGIRHSVQSIETPEQRLVFPESKRETGDTVKSDSIDSSDKENISPDDTDAQPSLEIMKSIVFKKPSSNSSSTSSTTAFTSSPPITDIRKTHEFDDTSPFGHTSSTLTASEGYSEIDVDLPNPEHGRIVRQISIEEPIVPTSTPRKRKRTDDKELQRDSAQPTQISLDERVVGVPEEITYPDQITIIEQIAGPSHAAAPDAIISQEMQTVAQEQLLSEPIPHPRKIMQASLPTDYKMRQQRIIDIVAKWNSSMGILTIEQVCEKPIHRLNIAKAFSDLLTLAAKRFLILNSEEDSIELKYIEKGPKLIK